MAAGCTVVIKPSPGTVLDCYIVAEAAHRGRRSARRAELGALRTARSGPTWSSHPGVDKVAFTGSTAAGRAIAKPAATCCVRSPWSWAASRRRSCWKTPISSVRARPSVGLPAEQRTSLLFGTRILVPTAATSEVVDAVAATVSSFKVGDRAGPRHADRADGLGGAPRSRRDAISPRARPKRGWSPAVAAEGPRPRLVRRAHRVRRCRQLAP